MACHIPTYNVPNVCDTAKVVVAFLLLLRCYPLRSCIYCTVIQLKMSKFVQNRLLVGISSVQLMCILFGLFDIYMKVEQPFVRGSSLMMMMMCVRRNKHYNTHQMAWKSQNKYPSMDCCFSTQLFFLVRFHLHIHCSPTNFPHIPNPKWFSAHNTISLTSREKETGRIQILKYL